MAPPILPSDAPLGAKLVDFGLRGGRALAVAVAVSSLLAVALTWVWPRPWIDRAIVEVGTKYVSEPLEHPVVTSLRIQALCLEASDRYDPNASVEVRPRRDEKTNNVTRILDVIVEASTASAAQAILDQGLRGIVSAHAVPSTYELGLVREQLSGMNRAVSRLEQAVDDAGSEDRGPLQARLYETRRMLDGVTEMVDRGYLPTRVASRASQPEPLRSRLPVLLLGGVLLGVLLGASWTAVKMDLARGPGSDPAASDPFLAELFGITHRYWRLILLVGGLGTALGLALGSRPPSTVRIRAVAQTGELSPAVYVEDLDAMASGLEAFVSGMVLSEALPQGTELDTLVIRDQPPSAAKQAMIELTATAPSAAAARSAVDQSLQRLMDAERPAVEAERARLIRLAEALEKDLQHAESLPPTVESHNLLIRLLIDRTDFRRRLSSVRVHPPRILLAPRSVPVALAPRISGYGVGLGLFGLLLGYGCAVFLAGLGYLRGIKAQRTE